ncbi:GRIM-19 protein-domain-containing protein [Cladochytrium replicatum]|nr:GRIM-19 protein-domain-containing protein [Cladochytrium replicatum]
MAAAPQVPFQDLPPPGGFPQTIRYERYVPKRGPSGLIIFGAAISIMAYGWYWVGHTNAERRELRREKTWARIHLVPLLQSETDRDHVRRLEATRKREADIMKDVEGWNAFDLKAPVPGVGKFGARDASAAEPVYHTAKYVPPTFVYLPWGTDTGWWRGSKMFLKNPEYHKREDWKEARARGENPIE